MAKKKTTEMFKQEVKDLTGDEYTVLSEYEGKDIKLTMKHNCDRCDNHTYRVKPNVFLNGRRCPKCAELDKKERGLKFEEFERRFKEKYSNNELEIVDKSQYKDMSTTKMDFLCNKCGNIWNTLPCNTLYYNCKYCQGKFKKDTDYFKEQVKSLTDDEYELVSEYKDTNSKVLINHKKCQHPPYPVLPKNFISLGNRCPYCNNEQKIERNNILKQEYFEYFKDTLKEKGYSINEDDYVDFKTRIDIKHDSCGNIMSRTPEVFCRDNGSLCPICYPSNVSAEEISLRNYIKSIDGTIIMNDRTILNGKELDIFSKNDMLGFEFNGLYWHSDIKKDKNYHIDKTSKCLEAGVKLIHIFEDEWIYKRNIVESKISYLLHNSNKPKIYARNCYVKEIDDSKVKNNFLNINHIQGEDRSNIHLGLYTKKDNMLVSVMTFCNPRISLGQKNSKYDGELSRFASDINYIVIGGFSKMWAYFCKEYEWSSIITYADKRWSDGNLYIKNGWKHLHDSKPNYWYCKGSKRYHRYNFRKQVLKDKFPNIYDDNLSEYEIMSEAGYFRIWDCGNMVFEYKRA